MTELTREQETKVEIAKRFIAYADRHAEERQRYERLESRRGDARREGRDDEAEAIKADALKAGACAALAAEGVQRQLRAMREEFGLDGPSAASTMQKVCDWMETQKVPTHLGDIPMLDHPAPNVGAAAKWSLDFLVQWRERIQATRAVKAWKEGAA